MKVKLKVFRYNPEQDKKPSYKTYELEAEPTDRVLDLLEYVKNYVDGTFSFRRSCAHGVCGSDAMRINGVNKLPVRCWCRICIPPKIHSGTHPGIASDQRSDRGYGTIHGAFQIGDALISSTMKIPQLRNATKPRKSVPVSMTQPNASCVPAVPLHVLLSGQMNNMSAQQPSSMLIVSSSIAAIRLLQKD